MSHAWLNQSWMNVWIGNKSSIILFLCGVWLLRYHTFNRLQSTSKWSPSWTHWWNRFPPEVFFARKWNSTHSPPIYQGKYHYTPEHIVDLKRPWSCWYRRQWYSVFAVAGVTFGSLTTLHQANDREIQRTNTAWHIPLSKRWYVYNLCSNWRYSNGNGKYIE
jgi:hypothetical protein